MMFSYYFLNLLQIILLVKKDSRLINRNTDSGYSHFKKAVQINTCFFQHIHIKVRNEPVLLKYRDKFIRVNHPAPGTHPPYKSLCTADPPAFQIDLGLQIHAVFPVAQRRMHNTFYLIAFYFPFMQFFTIKNDSVILIPLGIFQGQIRPIPKDIKINPAVIIFNCFHAAVAQDTVLLNGIQLAARNAFHNLG